MTTRGPLVAIEGIDGAGTTTQTQLLRDHLDKAGVAVHQTCEPTKGPIGELIRRALGRQLQLSGDSLALLFAADRLDHVHREISPRLRSGTVVITDRYLFSSLAYQGVDQDPGWVELINALAPLPDLTIYVRVDPELALERIASRGQQREIFENREHQTAIAARYDALLGSVVDPALHKRFEVDSEIACIVGDLRAGFVAGIREDPGLDPIKDPGLDPAGPLLSVVDGALPVEDVQKTVREVYEEFASRRGIWDARR